MNEIKELRVVKNAEGIEVNVNSDRVTALAMLSVLILSIGKEMNISEEGMLDVVGAAIKSMSSAETDPEKVKAFELEALGKPIVRWLKENSCPHAAVIIDDYGIRLVQDVIGIPTRKVNKDVKRSK